MKKTVCTFIILVSFVSFSHPHDRFLGHSVESVFQTIHGKLTSFFDKEEQPEPIELIETPHDLSPFQRLFRETISFTTNAKNLLTHTALDIIEEARDRMLTVEQAAERFIDRIEDAGEDVIHTLLQETLDIDLDTLAPSFEKIQEHVARLQQAVPRFKKAELNAQVSHLMQYLRSIQTHASSIQKAGIAQLSSQLASSAFSNGDYPLATAFNEIYDAYPTTIEKINHLKIPEAGLIAHSAFNAGSELVEQLALLHDSAGALGDILVDEPLVAPLDSLKNQIRKVGNALEFVTSTQPVVVVAPPTTSAALMEILKTYIWRSGATLQELAQEKIASLLSVSSAVKKQMKILNTRVSHFQTILSEFKPHLHGRFIQKLKENPLTTIPIAPKILVDVLEKEIEIVKTKLVALMHSSLVLTYRISEVTADSATLLGYVNEYMGATPHAPFIHKDIIRGIGFVSEDLVGFRTIIINVTEALKEYNPIPFRNELDPLELL